MRELGCKVEGGCMSARFHTASWARTRAAESYPRCKFVGNFSWFVGATLPVSGGT